MLLFLVGIVEMIIISTWTKVVTGNKVIASGLITVANTLIWYYVLQTVISDLSNWQLVLSYSFGCAIGTMLGTADFHWDKKIKKLKMYQWKKPAKAIEQI